MPVTRAQADINGKPLVFETGKYAKQAGGAVTVQYGDTVVFAAATVAKTIRLGIDFFPLTVDFEERLYAAGKIPGSFPRREGRPSEEGILTARLVDRPIRPLWPKGFRNDVQIIVSAWSADQENDYDVLAVNAASAALSVSNAPFEGPIGCVRVGTVNGELTLNPTIQQMEESDLDLVVAGTRDSIMMMEAGAREVTAVFEEILEQEFRKAVTEENLRPDGRTTKEIRPLSIEVGVLPRTHGSAVFTRGQTQVLSVTTLGPGGDEQIIDTLSPVDTKRYMHHYNFPPFSVGEVRVMRGARRREIGHGALAERALSPVLPTKEEFPYTIRVVSETLESNGSSSMASTCGSTLALMDAGVPIKELIGGIAMGLVTAGGKWTVLTDIQGLEDHYGDMDFKVAGSAKGITALQMDIKIKGISVEIMRAAFQQAREARLFILDAMRSVLDKPRPDLSRWAPRIETIKIPADKVREVIGPGGKMVRAIQAETGTTIELEDDGTVRITGAKAEGREKARAMIEGLTKEPEVGEIYDGKVTRIMSIGAFVQYLPGKEGLVRVGELSSDRVNRVEDIVKVGDAVKVKVAEVDRMGRVNLSIRAVNEDGNDYETRQRAERERFRERDERGGGPRRGPGGPGGGGRFRRGGPPR